MKISNIQRLFVTLCAALFITPGLAQNVGIGTASPHASAKLEVADTAGGLLIPRLTAARRMAIADPATGLLVFDTDSAAFFVQAADGWQKLFAGAEQDPKTGILDSFYIPRWSGARLASGLFYDNGSRVGLNTTTPAALLDVNGDIRADAIVLADGAAEGYVLVSDAQGLANWLHTKNLHIVTGLDTNFVARWNGTKFTNSSLFDDGGRVGINTLHPAQTLDVNGSTKTTFLQLTNGAQAGRVLQSDADGNAEWVSPGTISITENDPKVGLLSNNYAARWGDTSLVNSQLFDNGTNVGIGTATPAAKLHIDSGQLVVTGYESVGPQLDVAGPGIRMFFYPRKGAFRAGHASGSDWNDAQVGYYSVAMGNNPFAGAIGSTALGTGARAETTASNAVAIGHDALAMGKDALSMGYGAASFGDSATAIGHNALTIGNGATAIGNNVTAFSYKEVVTGSFPENYTPAGIHNWIAGDRLFVVGNGAADDSRGNAITVLKSGNTGIGISNPSQKLEVAGKIKTDLLQIANGAANGYVLQSDINGNAAWVNAGTLAITESDPKILSVTANIIPRWDGAFLKDGSIQDDSTNVGIGTAPVAGNRLTIAGITKTDSLRTTKLQITHGATNGYVLQTDAAGNAMWVNANTLSITETDPKLGNLGSNKIPYWNGSALTNGTLTDLNSRIGVGTAAPNNRLDVNGNAIIGGSYILSNAVAPLNGLAVEGTLNVGMPAAETGQNPYKLQVFNGARTVLLAQSLNPQGAWVTLLNSASGAPENRWDLVATGTANSEGTGALLLRDGAAVRMMFDKNGNAGIGTTTPAEKLDVNGKIKTTGFQLSQGAAAGYVLQGDAAGNAAWVSPATLPVTETDPKVGTLTNNYIPRWNNIALTDGLIYDNGTNVGIGTANPLQKLSVHGNIRATNPGSAPLGSFIELESPGNDIGMTLVRGNGLGGAAQRWDVKVAADSSLRFNESINNTLITITTAGNMGIGTAAPAGKLDVAGTTRTAGLQVTTGATNGYVLQGDAEGNAAWVNSTALSITEADPKVGTLTNNYLPKWNGSSLTNGLVFDNGTNVGIGTANPTNKLQVAGKTSTINLQMTNGAAAGYVLQCDALGNAAWVNSATLAVTETDPQVVAAAVNTVPKWNGSALTDGQIVDNGIAIGIGTNNPLARIHVKGSALIDSGRIVMRNNGQSVFIGEDAGTLDDFTFNRNVFIGNRSGSSSVTGTGNVYIGNESGTFNNGSNNVFIGNRAANTALNSSPITNYSNRLIIASEFGTPLIDGDFAAATLGINGALGVGTTTPTQAKLVVNGTAAQTYTSYGYLNRTTPTGTINGNTTPANYSIYASERIAASEFNAYSDARIKNIKGISNRHNDLKTLMAIEVTDYRLKDSLLKGGRDYKKVIAQQVETVYPQAVSSMTDAIPDIYRQADMKNGTVLLTTTLKPGDRVKLFYDSREEVITVKAATAGSFTVNSPYTGKVFVYGREVNDFRTVDYEALSTLNISATQALAEKIRETEAQNRALKVQVQQMKKDNESMKADIEQLKALLPKTL